MKVLFDINHPAHVHFFKDTIRRMQREQNQYIITASPKEHVTSLLDSLSFTYELIDSQHKKSAASMFRRLVRHDRNLIQATRRHSPDVLTAVGGTFASHAAWYLGLPSVVFYDTSEATLQNLLTYPLASRVVVPECYDGWSPKKRTYRYYGCHELAYLAPKNFVPSEDIAVQAGIHSDRKTVLLRLVRWDANHDIGLDGLRIDRAQRIVETIEASHGAKVIISSERELPASLEPLRYKASPSCMHHLMAFADLVIGESATMASEAAILGTPSILLDTSSRCYTRWIERDYSLVHTVSIQNMSAILDLAQKLLSEPRAVFAKQRNRLISNCEDVSDVIFAQIRAAAKAETRTKHS